MRNKQNPFEKHLKLRRIHEREWEFDYLRVGTEAHEELHEGIDLWKNGNDRAAIKIFRSLIKRFPEFIDAHHHLAIIHEERGDKFLALDIWVDIVQKAISLFPADFYFGRDRLPWSCLENRPFLRAAHALGLCYMDFDAHDKTYVVFLNILDLNPNDNQGARDLFLKCCFRLKRPRDVIRVCKRYRDDILDAVAYGKPLALFQLGRLVHAEKALFRAIQRYPRIASELMKKKSNPPAGLDESRVTLGGADQAYYYRQSFYEYWKSTPGALEFLQKCIKQMDHR